MVEQGSSHLMHGRENGESPRPIQIKLLLWLVLPASIR